MKIVIAPDSYKGSLSSTEAAAAMERGIKRFRPDADTVKVPIADGGEGTLDCLIASSGGEKVPVRVTGPLGEPVEAEFGLLRGGEVAVIEMAEASGLTLVPEGELNPMKATTYGTGELIRAALDRGCRQFILALGGSATNDGGAGMLQALGLRLTDREGREVPQGGGYLEKIAAIDDRDFDARIRESQFVIASDVQNPLVGPSGATHVYGPQKGATPEMVRELERGMVQWADVMAAHTGRRMHDEPGAGAAGGIGGAFLAFFPASIRRGIDVVIEHSRLRDELPGADLVLTGEGQIDHQTASGKTPMGIAQEAQKFGVPTIALAGSIGTGIDALYRHGICAVFSLVNKPMTLQQAMADADALLAQAAEQIVRTFCLGQRL
jgi:glycerate kinase